MSYFRTRGCCPACESTGFRRRLVVPFSDPRLRDFLASYYKGRVPVDSFADTKYELAECSCCDLIFQVNVLEDCHLQDLYERWISPQESFEKAMKHQHRDLYASEARSIERFFSKPVPEIRVLDFGCGWGQWLMMAKAFGYRVSGVEISEPRAEFVRDNGIDVFARLDEIDNETVDYIYSNQVFEHLTDPLPVLCELRKKLAPGGAIQLHVPQGLKTTLRGFSRWRPAKDPVHPLEHVNCFRRSTLERMGRRVGLVPDRVPSLAIRPDLRSWCRAAAVDLYNRTLNTNVLFRDRG